MRRELLGATVATLIVTAIAWQIGAARRQAPADFDPRPSTLLSGPLGARGLAQLLERLGTRVQALRRPLLPSTPLEDHATLLVLAPAAPIVGPAALRLAQQHERAPLILAGASLSEPMRCFGWRVRRLEGDSVRVFGVEARRSARAAPWVSAVLVRLRTERVTLKGSVVDGSDARCTVPAPVGIDTLARAPDGRPVAVRLRYADESDVTLAATDELFRNRTVRETAAASLAVAIIGVPPLLVVDEAIHGFAEGRSIWRVAAEWAVARAPGVAVLHLVITGMLVLLLRGSARVPPRALPLPPRRSSAEHVRALAAALAVAGGRVEAVRLLVRGLRRRLGDRRPSTDDAQWLADARATSRTAAARAALDRLALARTAPTDTDVLAAARAADDFRHETVP